MKGSELKKKWQKAKPLLLTKTGVSEILRTLPDDPTQAQLHLYAKASKDLATKQTNTKIAAEKKALACLKEIKKEIDDYLAHTKAQRAKVVEFMKNIHTVASRYHPKVQKGPMSEAVLKSFGPDVAAYRNQIGMLTLSGHDKVIVPLELMTAYRKHLDRMEQLSRWMFELMEDHKSQLPKLDIKVEYPIAWAKFGKHMAGLAEVHNKVDALEP